jgi:hypothetical protein
MAFGRKSNLPEGEVMFLRIRTKDANDVEILPAVFSVSKKDSSGKWETLPKTEQTVTGDLFRIDLGTGEYEGKPYSTVKVYLNDKDAKEIYVLDLRYNLLSRNLYNSLLALTKYTGVSVSLYKSKSKKDPNKEYSQIALWQGDSLVKGKFKNEELPKPEEIKNSKGVVLSRDYSELDSFIEKELKVLSAKLSKTPQTAAPELPPTEDGDSEPEGADKDIPF